MSTTTFYNKKSILWHRNLTLRTYKMLWINVEVKVKLVFRIVKCYLPYIWQESKDRFIRSKHYKQIVSHGNNFIYKHFNTFFLIKTY